jgi:hypothetical protein
MKLRVSEFRVWWDETKALSLLLLLLHTSVGREREREREARDGKECIWSLFVTFFAFFLSFFFSVASFLEAFFQNKYFCEILCMRFFCFLSSSKKTQVVLKHERKQRLTSIAFSVLFFSPPYTLLLLGMSFYCFGHISDIELLLAIVRRVLIRWRNFSLGSTSVCKTE